MRFSASAGGPMREEAAVDLGTRIHGNRHWGGHLGMGPPTRGAAFVARLRCGGDFLLGWRGDHSWGQGPHGFCAGRVNLWRNGKPGCFRSIRSRGGGGRHPFPPCGLESRAWQNRLRWWSLPYGSSRLVVVLSNFEALQEK